MSESGKAIFLSYASQDAEAARRICDTLRSAGVEVWFDQSELVGGDAWDQKIRKQIKECALLIPVISAATQARTEGYFRLEWRLADQRTHLMAKGRPFLLPVVIDDTKDADAQVPDSFLEVQWIKAPEGEVPAAFAARVQKLLSGDAGRGLRTPPTSDKAGFGDSALQQGQRPRWRLPVFGGLGVALIALVIARPWNKPAPSAPDGAAATFAAAPEVTAPPRSKARQMVEQAMALSVANQNDSAGLLAAADLAEKATQLDSTDAEVWAIAGRVEIRCWLHGADRTDKRQEMARTKILRAKSLAPRSPQVRFSEARMFTELTLYPDGAARAEAILSELLREGAADLDPVEVTGVLGIAVAEQGRRDEAAKLFEQAGRTSAGWMNAASWMYLSTRQLPEALAAAREQTKTQRVPGLIQQILVQIARGDLDAADEAYGQIPEADRLADAASAGNLAIAYCRRDPARILAALKDIPGDFLNTTLFVGPKVFLAGYAHRMAGRETAARAQWTEALALIDRRLATDNSDHFMLQLRLQALALLGRGDEAKETYVLMQQLRGGKSYPDEAEDLLLLGRTKEALANLSSELRNSSAFGMHSYVRYSISFDPLRNDPRFQQLLRETLLPGAKPFDEPKAADGGQKSVVPPVDQKSVAVLAFANLSDDKANEYFSDGISEELLNVLAKVPGLKVSARTSAFFFKGKEVPIPEIAQQLGVAYVVEGSVRKQGDRVRITAQLIKASDGFHVWSDTFTRDLKDIFAVQDEIAGLVAQQLQLKLGPARLPGAEVPTKVPAAYDAYLQARSMENKGWYTERTHPEITALLERAVELDPGFALAWAHLSFAHVYVYFSNLDHTEARLGRAKAAIEAARRFAPDSPDVLGYYGTYLYYGFRDYDQAREVFTRVARLSPNNAWAPFYLGDIARRQGRWAEALVNHLRAVELDPINIGYLTVYRTLLSHVRRYDEAIAVIRRQMALNPGGPAEQFGLALAVFNATGSKAEGEALFARMTPETWNSPPVIDQRKSWAFYTGDFVECVRLDRQQPYSDTSGLSRHVQALFAAIAYEAAGDLPRARQRLAGIPDQVRARLEGEPANSDLWQRLAQMEAILGNAAEAEDCMNRAVALVPEGRDMVEGVDVARSRAFVFARIGRKDEAIAEYTRFLSFPGSASVHMLRNGAFWAVLRGDAKWEAALSDPKNHAPLF